MEKKNLKVLLAKIDSKLNLLQAMVKQYETQIPTVAARIKQAQVHLQQKNIRDLYIDLRWITKNILGKKVLHKMFQHHALDLHILNEELARYSVKESDNPLNSAIMHWRKKILRSLESISHDLLIMNEKTPYSSDMKKSYAEFLIVENKLKNMLLLPSGHSEQNILSLLSIMTREIQAVNSIFLEGGSADMQALRKVLLQDWNTLLQGMVNLFSDAFKEVKPIREVRIIIGRTGVPELSIQAELIPSDYLQS